ncbi:MAG: peptidoglycan bridge formation protein FemAB, partial [Acidobacteriota bacterium]|nr:peptidoglycan bridge formation protein FemAB [Acidobacteriota bacterium]
MAGLEITLGGERDAADWDAFVESCPEASGYHRWRWRYVFERAFGRETAYLLARRDGVVVGVLPLVLFRSALFGRFAVSLPFVNYGGL